MTTRDEQPARLDPVRRRVALAKGSCVVAGALVFGAAFALARTQNPGHAKSPPHLRPLTASPRYLAVVRAKLHETGIVHPPLSSPEAATRQS